jgi:hypothetical protein
MRLAWSLELEHLLYTTPADGVVRPPARAPHPDTEHSSCSAQLMDCVARIACCIDAVLPARLQGSERPALTDASSLWLAATANYFRWHPES